MPLGSGAAERLPVWIRTRPSARVPDLDRNIAQSQAQMAIALWLITLAFGPASIRNRWFESSPLQQRVGHEPHGQKRTPSRPEPKVRIQLSPVARCGSADSDHERYGLCYRADLGRYACAAWLPIGGDLILAPHTTHASRDIDPNALARVSWHQVSGNVRPGGTFEKAEQLVWNEAGA